MSVPAKDHPCWQRLIQCQIPHFKPRQAALMFLLKKLQSSPESMSQRTQTLHEFFVKYERVLDAEINQLIQGS